MKNSGFEPSKKTPSVNVSLRVLFAVKYSTFALWK